MPQYACLICTIFFSLAELCVKLWPRMGAEGLLLTMLASCVIWWLIGQLSCWERVCITLSLQIESQQFVREDLPTPLRLTTTEPVREVEIMNPLITERIQQLGERTRVCSRRVWEETYLPDLRGQDGAEQMRASMSQCSICMSSIGMSEQIRGLACGHIFHLPCIAEWFMRDRTFELCCPLCRVPLSQQGTFRDWDKTEPSGD